MVEMTLVPYGYLHTVVPRLTRYFKRSEFWTNGRSSVDDIIRFLYTGEMHLWVVYEDDFDNILACLITEIKSYPQSKKFVIQYCSGDVGTLTDFMELAFQTFEQAGKDAGCSGLEFFGRPGWGQYMKPLGFTVQTVVYEKHFTDDDEA